MFKSIQINRIAAFSASLAAVSVMVDSTDNITKSSLGGRKVVKGAAEYVDPRESKSWAE